MAVIEKEARSLLEPAANGALPPLENGDHLDQPTFHARYQAMPENVHAELIGGIVFMASPVGRPHRRHQNLVDRWLGAYEDGTPGVEALGPGTVILGPGDEPEPDASLHLLPEFGGRTLEVDEYVTGAPELIIEVSASTASIDLHRKKDRYESAGVDEYVVVLLRDRKVRWFTLVDGRYEPLPESPDGILRSSRFPGLWLDGPAFIESDAPKMLAAVKRGVASAEHELFAAALIRAKRPIAP